MLVTLQLHSQLLAERLRAARGVADCYVCVEQEDLVDAVGMGMDDGVLEVFETVGASFERIALYVSVVHGAFEPLRTEVAFELI